LCRNLPLKHVTEGKIGIRIEVTGRQRRRRKLLLDEDLILENAVRSTRSRLVENWLCKSLWTCGRADNRMNEF